MNVRNIFSKIPECVPNELFEDIITAEHCKIERIVSEGHASPKEGDWYDQEKNEWVMVVKGRAGLRFEGEDEIIVMDSNFAKWLEDEDVVENLRELSIRGAPSPRSRHFDKTGKKIPPPRPAYKGATSI